MKKVVKKNECINKFECNVLYKLVWWAFDNGSWLANDHTGDESFIDYDDFIQLYKRNKKRYNETINQLIKRNILTVKKEKYWEDDEKEANLIRLTKKGDKILFSMIDDPEIVINFPEILNDY